MFATQLATIERDIDSLSQSVNSTKLSKSFEQLGEGERQIVDLWEDINVEDQIFERDFQLLLAAHEDKKANMLKLIGDIELQLGIGYDERKAQELFELGEDIFNSKKDPSDDEVYQQEKLLEQADSSHLRKEIRLEKMIMSGNI